MSSRPYPLRIPEGLLELAEIKSRAERTDKTTALRQLLYAGAEGYVLRLIAEGRVSVGRAAELLDITPHDIQRLAQEHDVKLGATQDQYRQAREVTRKLK
jgi:MOSC domain-containing protein YiiM